MALVLGQQVEVGIDPQEQVLLALTLAASLLAFSSGRTNIALGAVHLMLFLVYVVLIFDPCGVPRDRPSRRPSRSPGRGGAPFGL